MTMRDLLPLFDEEVQIQSKTKSGSVGSGPKYGDTRTVKAKIEMEGLVEGGLDAAFAEGRVLLLTNQPPRLGDQIFLPSPYPRNPDIKQVNPVKYMGKLHHVVVYFG